MAKILKGVESIVYDAVWKTNNFKERDKERNMKYKKYYRDTYIEEELNKKYIKNTYTTQAKELFDKYTTINGAKRYPEIIVGFGGVGVAGSNTFYNVTPSEAKNKMLKLLKTPSQFYYHPQATIWFVTRPTPTKIV